jgi:hypothetical protein
MTQEATMTTAERTDPHRDKSINPPDYTYLVEYASGSEAEPGFNIDCERPTWIMDGRGGHTVPGRPHHSDRCCLMQVRRSFPVFHGGAAEGSSSQCHVCGAWFRYGTALLHDPTGEAIFIGQDCAAKYAGITTHAEAAAYRKAMAEARTIAGREMKKARARDAFLAANPAFVAAVDAAKALHIENDANGRVPHHLHKHNMARFTLLDMADKVARYGSLNEKQLAYAATLAKRIAEPIPEAERHVDAPEGRLEVTGRVVSVRDHTSDYGITWKMVVKVETPDGTWLAWGTVPASILADSKGPITDWLKGRTVTFTGTLKRGDDAHFAFFKRPTKATVA